jgi:hypothetical protein
MAGFLTFTSGKSEKEAVFNFSSEKRLPARFGAMAAPFIFVGRFITGNQKGITELYDKVIKYMIFIRLIGFCLMLNTAKLF